MRWFFEDFLGREFSSSILFGILVGLASSVIWGMAAAYGMLVLLTTLEDILDEILRRL